MAGTNVRADVALRPGTGNHRIRAGDHVTASSSIPSGATATFGVIGGSGFYAMAGLEEVEQIEVRTPYGAPSSPITLGTLHGQRVAFIARHGIGHHILPAELPSRANIYAFKLLGVERLLAVSAVGSLQEQFAPLDAVVPGQLIDRTNGRPSTFFGEGAVAHIAFADPFCPDLQAALAAASDGAGVTTHRGGAMVVINGPAFSTRAESELYRSWGAAIIGMTALPEGKLAREAELCYGSMAFVTDYDVWHESEEDVSAELVLSNLLQNAEHGRTVVGSVIHTVAETPRTCLCESALGASLVTDPSIVPPATRQRLGAIVERYWPPTEGPGA
jgi:5'-methylthioadenosine phosphorylase